MKLRSAGSIATCVFVLTACTSGAASTSTSSSDPAASSAGRVDVGGYELDYACQGAGRPTVVLEAGYGTGGTSAFFDLVPLLAASMRVCTYDRAGTGTSDPRPASLEPVTGRTYARELHRLLVAIDEPPPYVMVGHSFGGLLVRTFAASYPREVSGMVLIDASSEPEIPIYQRMHAGAWIDRTSRVDIDAIVNQLRTAPSLGSMPLVVITAGILEDEWLKRVPREEARAQARLATLSTDAQHILAVGSGHFIQDENPVLVIAAIREVVEAAASGRPLAPCGSAVTSHHGRCP
jgi:pimeloyl-ACP methyl ester carboxylesterase